MTTLDQETAIRALRGCPLFAPCPEPVLADVGRRLRHRHFRRGEVIFHQGDPGDALHVIISGSVKIVLPSPEGEEAIIATLTEGDFFGELALLDGQPRSATAVAVEATETLSLPRDVFRELVEQHPELRDALFAALSSLLRRITHHVEELHFLDLAGRLAARLARLARETRHPSAGRIELDWPYTQSDLASMIGGTRQSVNRLLADLIDDGLVRVEHERLIITDLDALDRRAER
ncbi:MAG TPA: Crp/Fnr family transcriptional regulator [Candidatus Limnocylindria bacterium]